MTPVKWGEYYTLTLTVNNQTALFYIYLLMGLRGLIRLADTVSLRTTRQAEMGYIVFMFDRGSMLTESIQHYQLLCDALTNFTPCMLQKSKDEYGDTIYWLLDGCGDPDGDYFESLIDVEDYICNNVDIETYINNRK